MKATEGIRSPSIFKLWTGLVTLAGVLQRRVYTYTNVSIDPLCPNLWVTLTGPPATGKDLSINIARHLWSKTDGMHLASNNVTKASFIAEFENSARMTMNGSEDLQVFSCLAAPINEFGVFFPSFDQEFLSVLSHIYDNPLYYDEPRTSVKSRHVERPNFNMVAGITPDFMGSLFPETAWGQGFTSRMIFVYSEVQRFDNTNYFTRREDLDTNGLCTDLSSFFELSGEFEWSPEAQEAHIAWMDAGQPNAPEHSRLKHYASRRSVHLMKLSMLSAVSSNRKPALYITIDDYERAQDWLYGAEAVMPDVFRAMGQKSDAQLISDLWYYMWSELNRVEIAKRPMGIEDAKVWEFLRERAPSPAIPKIIETAERSGIMRRAPGSSIKLQWIPRPTNEHIAL